MFRRKHVPVSKHCGIGVTTERMKDGEWAVVATVTHSTGTAEQKFNLPVSKERFDSQPDAETYGVKTAQRWIAQNMPKSSTRSRRRRGVTGRKRVTGRTRKTAAPKSAR
jgi:hypothetical protein